MIRNAFLALKAFVFAVVLSSVAAQAQVENVVLRVDGLACPFCAYGLEKKIKKLEGYESIEVLINEGKVIVGWRDDKPLDLAAVDEAVRKAGFTLRGITGRFVGTVEKKDGRYFLVLPKPIKQHFYLYEAAALAGKSQKKRQNAEDEKESKERHSKNEGATEGLTAPTRSRLDQAIAEKERVRIIGPVHGHKDADLPPAIGIEKLEVLSPRDRKEKGNE